MIPPEVLALCLDKAYPTEFPDPKTAGLGVNFRKAYKILEKIDELRHKNIANSFLDRFYGLLPMLEEVVDAIPAPYRVSNVLHLNFESMYEVDPVNLSIQTKSQDSKIVMEVLLEYKNEMVEMPFTPASKAVIAEFLKDKKLEASISQMYFNQFWLTLGRNRTMYCVKNQNFKEYITVISRFPYSFYFLAPSTEGYKCVEDLKKFMEYTVMRPLPVEEKEEEKTPRETCFLKMIHVFRRINQEILPMICQPGNVRPKEHSR